MDDGLRFVISLDVAWDIWINSLTNIFRCVCDLAVLKCHYCMQRKKWLRSNALFTLRLWIESSSVRRWLQRGNNKDGNVSWERCFPATKDD